jgi:hypothetical protein
MTGRGPDGRDEYGDWLWTYLMYPVGRPSRRARVWLWVRVMTGLFLVSLACGASACLIGGVRGVVTAFLVASAAGVSITHQTFLQD